MPNLRENITPLEADLIMKILYIASNPKDEDSLALEREMTELQRQLMLVDRVGSITFRALPNLAIDKLPTLLKEFAPDLVHISAHGLVEGLAFSGGDQGERRLIETRQLVDLFRAVMPPPTLVYISACSAKDIARQLNSVVPFTIGTTAEVSNDAARESAVKFYEWLARGYSVAEAFEVSKPLLEIADGRDSANQPNVSSHLFSAKHQDPANKRFVEIFRMLASFAKLEEIRDQLRKGKKPEPLINRWGDYEIEIGFAGCPPDTRLLVLFTDDNSFIDQKAIDDDEDTLESQITWVRQTVPDGGEIWIEDETVEVNGDSRFYASIVTSKGECFTIWSKLSEALRRYYFLERWHQLPPLYEQLVDRSICEMERFAGPRRSKEMRSTSSVAGGRTKLGSTSKRPLRSRIRRSSK